MASCTYPSSWPLISRAEPDLVQSLTSHALVLARSTSHTIIVKSTVARYKSGVGPSSSKIGPEDALTTAAGAVIALDNARGKMRLMRRAGLEVLRTQIGIPVLLCITRLAVLLVKVQVLGIDGVMVRRRRSRHELGWIQSHHIRFVDVIIQCRGLGVDSLQTQSLSAICHVPAG